MARAKPPHDKRILCTSCGGLLVVSSEAKSVSCSHCNQRVICERLDVKDYVAVRKFRTANLMHIRKKGIVYASVWAEHLVIDGVLQGDAAALHTIRLGRKARVTADLRAQSLEVAAGAQLAGTVQIGREFVPELEHLNQPLPGDVLDEMEAKLQGPKS
jgi:hypothetical protein